MSDNIKNITPTNKQSSLNQTEDFTTNRLNLHSEQVREILGRPPRWLIRSGISVIMIVFLLMIVGSAFIKYPEIVRGIIVVGKENQTKQLILHKYGVGKIKSGQKVILKFEEYPYLEYGFVQITLDEVELKMYQSDNADKSYFIDIPLSDSLITFSGNTILLIEGMSGVAEIITEDFSILDRILNPIKAVLKR